MKILLLAAALAAAEAGGPRALTLSGPPSVRGLRDAFAEAVADERRAAVLAELSRTPPSSAADLQALFDLFLRFPVEPVRQAALQSLHLAPPGSPTMDPLVLRYLNDPDEPAAVLFAIKAAVRLRVREALPVIRKLAARPFKHKVADDSPVLGERNLWWVQYEALTALAQWEGAAALPLLERKSKEAPAVARIMGLFLWKESLPRLAAWAGGSEPLRHRAAEGLDAPTPLPHLRETRERMLAYVRDPKAPKLLRHKLALKVGLCSEPAEVAALIAEHEKAPAETRLYLAAAIFASRDPQAVPLLASYLKDSPTPQVRSGALVQLHDMLPPEQFRPYLEWAAAHEPDPENRESAARQLAGMK